MSLYKPSLSVDVDVTNPGQFFASCGLLELAHRLWPGARARFADGACFEISEVPAGSTVPMLVQRLRAVGLTGALTPELADERNALETEYKKAKKAGRTLPIDREARRKYLGGLLRAGSITVDGPFCLLLDWWQSDSDEVPKTWAGSMQVRRVALAALNECGAAFEKSVPFDYSCVLRPADEDDDGGDDPRGADDEEGKAEPFYFDSTRGTNASPVDQGGLLNNDRGLQHGAGGDA